MEIQVGIPFYYILNGYSMEKPPHVLLTVLQRAEYHLVSRSKFQHGLKVQTYNPQSHCIW